jgi:hypothetical protein
MRSTIKQPSAWLPIVISLGVLAIMLGSFATFGVPRREADEGAAAHLFQLWLVIEVVMIAFFATTWLPKKPKQALLIVGLQVVAMLAAMAPVRILGL